jgi:hypothetical protein
MPKYKHVNNELIEITGVELEELNAREQAWKDSALDRELQQLRKKRNKLLLECDWIELNNAPLTDLQKNEWRVYRTELRDLTNGLTTADEVIAKEFPTKPSE